MIGLRNDIIKQIIIIKLALLNNKKVKELKYYFLNKYFEGCQ